MDFRTIKDNKSVYTLVLRTKAPSTTDDLNSDFVAGLTRWIDTTNGRSYICSDDTPGAAVWQSEIAPTSGRSAAVVAAAVAAICSLVVGSADASFEVTGNILVTTSSAEAFALQCTYTDEGNTARTLVIPISVIAGTVAVATAFANGAVPYHGHVLRIRAKAGSTITIKTAGTFTGCTYNVEGSIKQVA